jgi:uncharacterized protein YaaN involved in tellurite resistance
MTDTQNVPPASPGQVDDLVLRPPDPVPAITPSRVAATARVGDDRAREIGAAVSSFVDSLTAMDATSPDFDRKVQSVSQMGNPEIRRSADFSNRFLDRPTRALEEGPLSKGSNVSTSLVSLRRQLEDLDPSRALGQTRGLFRKAPFNNRVRDYFHKYQSAQSSIQAIIQALYRGQDELMRDNAAIAQERQNMWAVKERLDQYVYMAERLDEALTAKIEQIQGTDPEKARALKEDVLFYVRQKRQDLLTQLAVNVQAYLALDLVRKNNVELIKGVDRASTTTVSALRTAVITALALNNQKLVLDQVTALNTTTGNLIESTSRMLRDQTGQIQQQAASATVSIEKLQVAFNNVYETMNMIDTFKLSALDNMRKTIDVLSGEISKAQEYIDRARTAEGSQARFSVEGGELTLPGGGGQG